MSDKSDELRQKAIIETESGATRYRTLTVDKSGGGNPPFMRKINAIFEAEEGSE